MPTIRGEREELSLPRQTTVESLLRQRCGFASAELPDVGA